jgi:hypothetical protein
LRRGITPDEDGSLSSRGPRTRAGTPSKEHLYALVDQVNAFGRTRNWPGVVAVEDFDSLPEEVKVSLLRKMDEHPARHASGVMYRGTVYLIRTNLDSMQEAQATVLHEIAGHIGFRRLFGKQVYEKAAALFDQLGGVDGMAAQDGLLQARPVQRRGSRVLVAPDDAHRHEPWYEPSL